jgi:alpha-methylacyl-CoA racemase
VLLEGTDVCFAPVLSFAEAPDHPHNRAREVYVEVDGLRQPAPAPKFSATPPEVRSSPAGIGTHSQELLELAGFGVADIDALRATGIV